MFPVVRLEPHSRDRWRETIHEGRRHLVRAPALKWVEASGTVTIWLHPDTYTELRDTEWYWRAYASTLQWFWNHGVGRLAHWRRDRRVDAFLRAAKR